MTVKEVQTTPNPNAMKYILRHPVTDHPVSFFTAEAAQNDTLGRALFSIPGVQHVLMLGNFITVNKSPEARWTDITKAVRKILEAKGPPSDG